MTKSSLRGVNLAGQESGSSIYAFPTVQGVDYFASKGATAIRVTFLMERLGASPGATVFTEPYATYLANLMNYILAKGMRPILDPHNAGRFQVGCTIVNDAVTGGATAIIGQDPGYTAAQFAAFHVALYERFPDKRIIRGLMNEPNTQVDATLLATHQAAITALRGAGCDGLILVNGNNWGSYAWDAGSPNRTYMPQISDPLDNWAVDLHHYLDAYGAGQSVTVVPTYMDKLVQFTAYARSMRLKAFVGEIGAGGDVASLGALEAVLSHIEDHPDVYLGWTYWDAVQYQDSYIFQVMPKELSGGAAVGPYTDKPQMAVLAAHW